MSELHRHRIRLSPRQKSKLRVAFKKRRTVVIGLGREDLSGAGGGGGEHVLLTELQHRSVNRAVKNNTGLRLVMSYDQLVKNKEGGLLKQMLDFVETSVPGGKRFISPLVKNDIAPMLKNHFLPWLKNLIEHELDTIIATEKTATAGSGVKRVITDKLDSLLRKKNPSSDH